MVSPNVIGKLGSWTRASSPENVRQLWRPMGPYHSYPEHRVVSLRALLPNLLAGIYRANLLFGLVLQVPAGACFSGGPQAFVC